MQIADLKELKRLLKLCRSEGVTEITLGEISFKLGDKPQSISTATKDSESTEEVPLEGGLTEEELVFWSASPTADNQ